MVLVGVVWLGAPGELVARTPIGKSPTCRPNIPKSYSACGGCNSMRPAPRPGPSEAQAEAVVAVTSAWIPWFGRVGQQPLFRLLGPLCRCANDSPPHRGLRSPTRTLQVAVSLAMRPDRRECPLVWMWLKQPIVSNEALTGLPAGILVVGQPDLSEGQLLRSGRHPTANGPCRSRNRHSRPGLRAEGSFDASEATSRPSHSTRQRLVRSRRSASGSPSCRLKSLAAVHLDTQHRRCIGHSTSTSSGCTRLPSRSSPYGAAATSHIQPSGLRPDARTRVPEVPTVRIAPGCVTRTVLPRRSGIRAGGASHARKRPVSESGRRSACWP